ncbi:MAG: hypothetical protein H0X27_11415 [Caulobacteraceae bacterium]|nr:hypothetical protein [Caulobacteraceae bacterium]
MSRTWRVARFDSVVRSRGSGPNGLPQSEWGATGRYPVIGQGAEFIEGWTDRDDLVINPSPEMVLYGGHTRRAKHVLTPFVPGPNVKLLYPSSDLTAGFLYYFLESLEIPSKGYADHFPLVRRVEMPIPPLREQRRIIETLDEAFGGIGPATANLERNLANVREFIASASKSLLSDEDATWQSLTLDEALQWNWITSHLDGNHGSLYPRKDEFVRSGVPYVSANCIDGDQVDLSRAKYLTEARASTIRKGVAQDGDIIFAHNATVGPVAILRTTAEKVILSTSVTYYVIPHPSPAMDRGGPFG